MVTLKCLFCCHGYCTLQWLFVMVTVRCSVGFVTMITLHVLLLWLLYAMVLVMLPWLHYAVCYVAMVTIR